MQLGSCTILNDYVDFIFILIINIHITFLIILYNLPKINFLLLASVCDNEPDAIWYSTFIYRQLLMQVYVGTAT